MMSSRYFSYLVPSVSAFAATFLGTSCTSPVVSDSALSFAKQRVVAEVGETPKKGSLVIVDYTKPSSQKRMTVVDLKTGRARMNSLVAHGVNSGLLYAQNFSDRVGSNQSSLGLYRIAEPYVGKHGPSLRLDGLDPGYNINARKRAIVIHAADYVSKDAMRENRNEGWRLGRSAGCLSLSDKDMVKFSKKIERPAYVFAYAPAMLADQTYKVPASQPAQPATAPPAPAPAMPAPVPNQIPQPMLASAGNVPVNRDENAAAPAPASPEMAAAPRPQLLGTSLATAGSTVSDAERRERRWTPLTMMSDAIR